MSGVKVGDGAIIAAKSIVTKDVSAYAIVGGNPTTLIRYRFDEQSIERPLRIRWWDWDAEKIARNVKMICSGDIDALEKAI